MQKIYLADIKEFIGEGDFFLTFLSEKERERIASYKDINAKLRSLVGRVMINAFTGKEEILYGEHGKPYKTLSPFFNLSHSGDYVVLSVNGDAETGVDTEKIRPIKESVAQKIFTDIERNFAKEKFSADKADIALWTIKEAAAKCLGCGINSPKSQSIDFIDEVAFNFCGNKLYYKTYFYNSYIITACSTVRITADICATSSKEIKARLFKN